MAKLGNFDFKEFRVLLTFGNGSTYVASTKTDDKYIFSLEINEDNGNTYANPIGILSSNTLSISIIDNNNRLVITNKNSPYYGYMKENVKVELFYDDEPMGVYFTDGWSSAIEYGSGYRTSLYCYDRMVWLGNLDVPKISAFTSMTAKSLLNMLLLKCGLSVSEFSIDTSLSDIVTYSISSGKKMRDVLNEVCQVMLAKITCNRQGRIIIESAFNGSQNSVGELYDEQIQSLIVKNNTDNMYKHVKLNYTKITVDSSVVLANIKGQKLIAGYNYIDSIVLGDNCLGVDSVRVVTGASQNDFKIKNIVYGGTQGGLNIMVDCTSACVADIVIEGRRYGGAEAVVYSHGYNEDDNSDYLLTLTNKYITDNHSASAYVNDVKAYLDNIKYQYTISSPLLGLNLTPGVCFRIHSSSKYAGLFYVKSVKYRVDSAIKCTLDVIKVN